MRRKHACVIGATDMGFPRDSSDQTASAADGERQRDIVSLQNFVSRAAFLGIIVKSNREAMVSILEALTEGGFSDLRYAGQRLMAEIKYTDDSLELVAEAHKALQQRMAATVATVFDNAAQRGDVGATSELRAPSGVANQAPEMQASNVVLSQPECAVVQ